MANLKFGDKINLENAKPIYIENIQEVVPIKFDALDEQWVVVAQGDATHMLIIADAGEGTYLEHILFEIGKCKNTYLLADAIVD